MARLGFTAIAALLLGAALALWVAPEAESPRVSEPRALESSVGSPPAPNPPTRDALAREAEAAPELPGPDSPPVVAEASVPVARPGPDTRAGAPEREPDPPVTTGVPTLPEEQREIAAVLDFEPDHFEPERGTVPSDVSAASPSADPAGSEDLIRRMLALYRQLRD